MLLSNYELSGIVSDNLVRVCNSSIDEVILTNHCPIIFGSWMHVNFQIPYNNDILKEIYVAVTAMSEVHLELIPQFLII